MTDKETKKNGYSTDLFTKNGGLHIDKTLKLMRTEMHAADKGNTILGLISYGGDGDGRLSGEEMLRGLEKRFKGTDIKIPNELVSTLKKMGHESLEIESLLTVVTEFCRAMDTSGDGELSLEELKAGKNINIKPFWDLAQKGTSGGKQL